MAKTEKVTKETTIVKKEIKAPKNITFEREYYPDINRQVAALKVLLRSKAS